MHAVGLLSGHSSAILPDFLSLLRMDWMSGSRPYQPNRTKTHVN